MKPIFKFLKIEHTLFSLPLIFSGIFLSSKSLEVLSLKFVLLILSVAVSARTFAMTINRVIDKKIDKLNPRTSNRELPSGKLKLSFAIFLLLISGLIYFFLAYKISNFCFYISPIPIIVFTIYPYMKRFTKFAHFGVGISLSLAALGGWFATETFNNSNISQNTLPIILFFLFTVFWATGFDIIYSTLDEEFDKKENLFSFPSRLGKEKALKFSALFHIVAFLMLILLYFIELKNIFAFFLLLINGFLLFLEHKKSADIELAFFKINSIIGFSVLFMILTNFF